PPLKVNIAEPISDVLLAHRFAELNRTELRYLGSRNKWLVWTGKNWKEDNNLEVNRRVETMVRSFLQEFAALPATDRDRGMLAERLRELRKYLSTRRLDDVRQQVRINLRLQVSEPALDAKPWLFNVQNATINLRTGKLRKHRARDLLTQISPAVHSGEA